jgi:hypothetical protein
MALNSTVWQISNLLGPAIAGACIALTGLPNTYGLNGGVHLITLGALAVMHVGPVLGRPRQSPLKDIGEGLSFVRFRSIILVLLSMDVAARFFGSYQALLPVFADRLGAGPEGLGLLLSAPAAGGLFGSMVILSLGNLRYKGLLIVAGILGYCLALIVLAVSPWFLLALGAAALLGLFDSFNATPRNTLIQAMTASRAGFRFPEHAYHGGSDHGSRVERGRGRSYWSAPRAGGGFFNLHCGYPRAGLRA